MDHFNFETEKQAFQQQVLVWRTESSAELPARPLLKNYIFMSYIHPTIFHGIQIYDVFYKPGCVVFRPKCLSLLLQRSNLLLHRQRGLATCNIFSANHALSGSIGEFYNNTGFMFDIAPEFNALIVFAEVRAILHANPCHVLRQHRFYGASLPYGKDSFMKVGSRSK